ncbi:MAG: cache domain-containing protein [Dongiaceae bacterium]
MRDGVRGSLRLLLVALATATFGAFAPVQAAGTAEEAQAMVAKAIAFYRDVGAEAFHAINRPDGGFRDRDLYVFVFGPDNRLVAHGADVSLLGQDAMALKDVDGRPFGRAMVETATEEGAWVDYRWPNPETGKTAAKSSWVVKADGYIFGCGIYKP